MLFFRWNFTLYKSWWFLLWWLIMLLYLLLVFLLLLCGFLDIYLTTSLYLTLSQSTTCFWHDIIIFFILHYPVIFPILSYHIICYNITIVLCCLLTIENIIVSNPTVIFIFYIILNVIFLSCHTHLWHRYILHILLFLLLLWLKHLV